MGKEKYAPLSNIGASTYSTMPRITNDYYATSPQAITLLHKHHLLDKNIPYWECAVGGGNLSKELKRLGYDVELETDLYDYGYPEATTGIDFLKCKRKFRGNIITNPPYNQINKWIPHQNKLATHKSYIFARIQTIETIKRYENIFKKDPPILICPFVKRIKCYPNNKDTIKSSAICYAWFIWDNQVDNNETIVKWLI